MEQARYHPSIAIYTYIVEYVETIPSKKSYREAQGCAVVGLQYGKARFGCRLVNVRVLKDGKVIESWQQ